MNKDERELLIRQYDLERQAVERFKLVQWLDAQHSEEEQA
jgi:hypothetical protein